MRWELKCQSDIVKHKQMLTDCCFYTIQVYRAERTEDQKTPAEQNHWLVPKKKESACISQRHPMPVKEPRRRRCRQMSDLLSVKDAEQRLSRAQTATLSPSEEQQQTG